MTEEDEAEKARRKKEPLGQVQRCHTSDWGWFFTWHGGISPAVRWWLHRELTINHRFTMVYQSRVNMKCMKLAWICLVVSECFRNLWFFGRHFEWRSQLTNTRGGWFFNLLLSLRKAQKKRQAKADKEAWSTWCLTSNWRSHQRWGCSVEWSWYDGGFHQWDTHISLDGLQFGESQTNIRMIWGYPMVSPV